MYCSPKRSLEQRWKSVLSFLVGIFEQVETQLPCQQDIKVVTRTMGTVQLLCVWRQMQGEM